jgi:hypothetical protein
MRLATEEYNGPLNSWVWLIPRGGALELSQPLPIGNLRAPRGKALLRDRLQGLIAPIERRAKSAGSLAPWQATDVRQPSLELPLNRGRYPGELIFGQVRRIFRLRLIFCLGFAGGERGWFASAIIRGRTRPSIFGGCPRRPALGRFSRAAWFPPPPLNGNPCLAPPLIWAPVGQIPSS